MLDDAELSRHVDALLVEDDDGDAAASPRHNGSRVQAPPTTNDPTASAFLLMAQSFLAAQGPPPTFASFASVPASNPFAPPAPAESRIPVIIISGYAAAGKTTLVNRLLLAAQDSGLRIGVIAHRQAEEYGIEPNPLEAPALAQYSETVYDFGSGCICCSPKGDLTRLLTELAHSRQAAAAPAAIILPDGAAAPDAPGGGASEGAPPLDALLLRLGPLAAPLVFAKAVCSLDEHFALASVVTVCAAALATRHLAEDSPEWQARAQVASADLVLANGGQPSCDGKPSARGALESFVRTIHADVAVEPMPAAHETDRLLALLRRRGRFSTARAAALDPEFARDAGAEAPALLVSLTPHDKRLGAACAVEEGPVHASRLRALLERLVGSGRVLRIKGVISLIDDDDEEDEDEEEEEDDDEQKEERGDELLAVADCGARTTRPPRRVVVEGVEESWQVRAAPPPKVPAFGGAAEPPPPSKLFILGRSLAVGSLRRDFQECGVPRGYLFAADSELHFTQRLTAASTRQPGLAQRPRCVASESLPGVTVVHMRPAAAGGGASNHTGTADAYTSASAASASFVAFERPHEADTVEVEDDPEHGPLAIITSPSAKEEAAAAVATTQPAATRYRLSDGVQLKGEEECPCRLRLLPVIVVSGAVYAKK